MKSCENCKHRYGSGGEHPCNTCIYTDHGQPTGWEAGVNYTPMTNSDHIREMSDKELARLLVHATANGCPPSMDWNCARDDESGWDACDACWARWLQQPAETELLL